ncbi:MAG: RecX family transcriptional regulator, partial [Clostridia bacterium]|nr:RecX family transcriptional regulator [Clostridia bacterium]
MCMYINDILVNNTKITIILEDNSEYVLHEDIFSTSNITRSIDVNVENLGKLVRDSQYLFCREYLMKQISNYYKTSSGYYKKLIEKKYPKDCAIKAIEYAKEKGYIDDQEYAQRYYESNKTKKSVKKILYELNSKGIKQEYLEFLNSTEDIKESIIKIANRYTKNKELTYELKTKIYRNLISKGFDYDLVNE